MADPTPEYEKMDAIVDELISGGWIEGTQGGNLYVGDHAISALAAPLEAANARIKELDAEIAPLRQFVGHSLVMSDYRTADEMRTQIATLREAVRVLAKECHTWRKRHDVEDVNRMGYSDIDAVNANPTARAAIEVARAPKEQA